MCKSASYRRLVGGAGRMPGTPALKLRRTRLLIIDVLRTPSVWVLCVCGVATVGYECRADCVCCGSAACLSVAMGVSARRLCGCIRVCGVAACGDVDVRQSILRPYTDVCSRRCPLGHQFSIEYTKAMASECQRHRTAPIVACAARRLLVTGYTGALA